MKKTANSTLRCGTMQEQINILDEKESTHRFCSDCQRIEAFEVMDCGRNKLNQSIMYSTSFLQINSVNNTLISCNTQRAPTTHTHTQVINQNY